MKLQDIKPGDTITVRGTGYLSNRTRTYTVKRVTKTQIVGVYHGIAKQEIEVKINRADGCQLPRDKYINYYIETCNGEIVE